MTSTWTPVILDESDTEDRTELERLRADPQIEFLDRLAEQRAGLAKLTPPVEDELRDELPRWVYYPWRRTVLAILGPASFRRLRLDRNRNKITAGEQARLAQLTVGVVGLSVGHAIAYAIAMDGLCGELRLADFDEIELSNLNRIPATLLDLGIPKPVVAARRIAELDPYLRVTVDLRGVTKESAPEFVAGLDVLLEECDSLDVKVLVRETARAQGVPVIMETSDRGLLDVERYDLEPDRPLFHGLLGDIDSAGLEGLTTHEKVPYVLAILGTDQLSARMAASMIEVDRTTTTWPQLGSEVGLGGATVAAAVRRFGLGLPLQSGRVRIHLDEILGGLGEATMDAASALAQANDTEHDMPDAHAALAPHLAVAHAAARAPSGGNVQPWTMASTPESLVLQVNPSRTTGLDVAFRGSHVAVGAALLNARIAAAHLGVLGEKSTAPDGTTTLTLAAGTDADLADLYQPMNTRTTNRHLGTPRPIPADDAAQLDRAAREQGTRVVLVTEPDALGEIAEIFAATDRIRYITPTLHTEMISELRWPGQADPNRGIDVHALALDPTDLVKLDVSKRSDVMALLGDWDAGSALGDDTRDRIRSASALAVVVVEGREPADFVRGGSGVESVWITAQNTGLAVHPVSPTFIYAHSDEEFAELSTEHAPALAELRRRFSELVGIGENDSIALVLRLSHTDAGAVRSRREPVVIG